MSGSSGNGIRKKAQLHSGKLMVSIIPEYPTSSDDLQVVFTQGGAVSFQWKKNGQSIDGENGPKLPRSFFARDDTVSVTVSAGGEEGTATVTITNSPPEIKSVRLTPDKICRGVNITAVPEGADRDGDDMNYRCKWIINGEESTGEGLVLKGDSYKQGDTIAAAITPYDGYGPGDTYRTQAVTIPKAAPCFISTPPTTFSGRTYTYEALARDPDGGTITYSLASSPAGMTIDEKTGRISWQIDGGAAGLHNIKIVARNSEGDSSFQEYNLDITIQPGASE